MSFSLLDAPGHLLRRAHQRSQEVFARIVGDDVTRQQVALLIALAQRPGASQRELVEHTGIDRNTIKEMVGRMVVRGLVERERDTVDGRAWTMRVSQAGLRLVGERLPRVEEVQEEILAQLSAADRETFLRCLRIVAAAGDANAAT